MPMSTSTRPDELLKRLAALDSQFPPGLRADRPYSPQELIHHGPFPSEGSGMRRIRNPITGAPMDMPLNQTPQMYLAATNALAEAKGRAQANVIRGWNSEQAASEALARAYGVDPMEVAGLGIEDAGGVIEGNVRGRNERRAQADQQRADYEQFAGAQRERMGLQEGLAQIDPDLAEQVRSIQDPSQASLLFRQTMERGDQERGRVAREREDFEKRRGQMEVSGVLSELDLLDPAEAARKAPGLLAKWLEPAGISSLVGRYQDRADAEAETIRNAQKDWATSAEKDSEHLDKNVLAPLRAAMSAKVSAKAAKADKDMTPSQAAAAALKPAGAAGGDVVFDYEGAVAEQISNIQLALANLPGDVDLAPILKNIEAPEVWGERGIEAARTHSNQQRASQDLAKLARALERSLREEFVKQQTADFESRFSRGR